MAVNAVPIDRAPEDVFAVPPERNSESLARFEAPPERHVEPGQS